MSQGRGFVVGVDVAQLNLHRMESDDLDVTAIVWCGGWDSNPRTPTGQGPEPCAFDLAWQPPLGGGVRKLSDKAVCRRRVQWAPVLHERYCCSFSGFVVSGSGGIIGGLPVLPGIPLYFSISRSLFSQSRICLSFSSWLRICEVLL